MVVVVGGVVGGGGVGLRRPSTPPGGGGGGPLQAGRLRSTSSPGVGRCGFLLLGSPTLLGRGVS